jgi:hypothetical protein
MLCGELAPLSFICYNGQERKTCIRLNAVPIPQKRKKVAQKISVLLSDFTLDLEKVGYYLARAIPLLLFKRSLEVLESAQFQEDYSRTTTNRI